MMTIGRKPWAALFESLRDAAEYNLDSDVLWLLNPTWNPYTEPKTPFILYRYDREARDAAISAAKEARIVYIRSYLEGGGLAFAGAGRGHEFSGFQVFEEDRRANGS